MFARQCDGYTDVCVTIKWTNQYVHVITFCFVLVFYYITHSIPEPVSQKYRNEDFCPLKKTRGAIARQKLIWHILCYSHRRILIYSISFFFQDASFSSQSHFVTLYSFLSIPFSLFKQLQGRGGGGGGGHSNVDVIRKHSHPRPFAAKTFDQESIISSKTTYFIMVKQRGQC